MRCSGVIFSVGGPWENPRSRDPRDSPGRAGQSNWGEGCLGIHYLTLTLSRQWTLCTICCAGYSSEQIQDGLYQNPLAPG